MVTIKNDTLTLLVDERGAEMTSLRTADGREVLWSADPKVWGRHAPLLFPVVGALGNGVYRHGGQTYAMDQHGFARDGAFVVESREPDAATLLLRDTPASRAIYPFAFALRVGYRLRGNTVEVRYTVDNLAREEMLFSIGAHPGFACPMGPGEDYSDCFLEFEEPETLGTRLLNASSRVAPELHPFLQGERVLPLGSDTFRRGAFILEGFRSQAVTLRGGKSGHAVRVAFPGFPYLGIWAMPGAPFVCIEPWFGVADLEGFEGEFADKAGVMRLAPGGTFRCAHTITVE